MALLDMFGSKAVVATLARLVSCPEAIGVARMVTLMATPPVRVPRLQLTVPPLCEQVPWLTVAET